ncbi:MAG: hypothetical protein WCL56_10450, partial [Sediminibacterium sp.]
ALNTDTATLITRFNNVTALANLKVNISDTSAMLNAYKLKVIAHDAAISALNTDTATLITRFNNVTALANLKVNISDTSAMLNPYKLKVNIADTSTMLANYKSSIITLQNNISNSNLPSQTGMNGKVLSTNGTTPSWIAQGTISGSYTLQGATDAAITTPSNGQMLQFSNNAWTNITPLLAPAVQTYQNTGTTSGTFSTQVSSATTFNLNNAPFNSTATIFLADNKTLKALNTIIVLNNNTTNTNVINGSSSPFLIITLPDATKNNGKSIIIRPSDNYTQVLQINDHLGTTIDTNLGNITRAGNLVHVMSDGLSWQVISSR